MNKRSMLKRILSVAVAFACSAVRVEAQPADAVDYAAMLSQAHAEHQPAGEDAWPHYAPLVERYAESDALPHVSTETPDGDSVFRMFGCLLQSEWGDPRHAPFLAAPEEHRATLDALAAAAAPPACTFPLSHDDGMLSMHFPEIGAFGKFRDLTRAGMRDAANRGDWKSVERLLNAGIRNGLHLTRHPSLMGTVIGSAMWASLAHEAALLALELDAPADAAERMADAIDPLVDPGVMPPTWPLPAERVLAHNIAAQCVIYQAELEEWEDEEEWDEGNVWLEVERADGGEPEPVDDHEAAVEALWKRLAESIAHVWDALEDPVTAQTHEDIDDAFDLLEAWAAQPPAQRAAAKPTLPEYEFRMINDIAQANTRFIMFREAIRIEVAARSLTLRLVAHRQRAGRWPVSLDELNLGNRALDPVLGQNYLYTAPIDAQAWPSLRVPDSNPFFTGRRAEKRREMMQPRMSMPEDLR